MENKKCFKCGELKELSLFYKHKKMADGHVNKCITCSKKEAEAREKRLRENPEFVEKEKIRLRERYHRLGYKDVHKSTAEDKKLIIKKYKDKFPEKIIAQKSLFRKIKAKPGFQLHHWSYNENHYLDIIELSVLEHKKLHRYIIYDQERMMYRRIDTNELLDTKEKHIEYYNSLLNKP